MIYDPDVVFAALKALRSATNRYVKSRQQGETGQSILKLENKMLASRKHLRYLLNVVFDTVPEQERPDDLTAQLQMVAVRLNWSDKNLILYRALEKLIDEILTEDAGGEKSALWVKMLENLQQHKEKSASKVDSPKSAPIEEDDFKLIEHDVGEDWEVIEAGDLSEITDEAYVKLLYSNLPGAYYPYYDYIHEEVV